MRLGFTIEFHGPFRVATGRARPGVDIATDPFVPLPGSSLKGLMRASSADVLGLPTSSIDAIYGAESPPTGQGPTPSPWSWSDADFGDGEPWVTQRSRVAISGATGVVEKGALVRADELWPANATFTVDLFHHLTEEEKGLHQLLLAAAAKAVRSIGADRNRGFGWVTIESDSKVDFAQLRSALEAIKSQRKGSAGV